MNNSEPLAFIEQIGRAVGGFVLDCAAFLREDYVPGLVVVALLAVLVGFLIHLFIKTNKRCNAIEWLDGVVSSVGSPAAFSEQITDLDLKIKDTGRSRARQSVANAWDEYRETIVHHEQDGQIVLRNAVRPSSFFNLEDLHFGSGFWRILPGLFVTTGLFLTFLGLISALDTMGGEMESEGELSQGAMTTLLTVASAKFIMSLSGLLCSIIFTIFLRIRMGRIESAIHQLNRNIEERLSYISLEALAVEQLRAIHEQKEHFRSIGMELVAELGRPLREEIPKAISQSISDAMSPILTQVGQMSSDGVGAMVKDLSSRFSDDVGRALSDASDRLGDAGDQIGKLVDRMDQSSGRMGTEMEGAVARLGQAVDELRQTMTSSADATTGAFSQGAESLLAAMNTTLQGIRENTGEGAKAISAAAAEMRAAGEGIRAELDAAAKDGALAAQNSMKTAGDEASGAIGKAGAEVLDALSRNGAEIAKITDAMTEKAGQGVIQPLQAMSEKLEEMVAALSDSATQVKRASDGMRDGANASTEAATTFRGSAQALVTAADPVRASVERMEGSTRSLSESVKQITESTRANAASAAQVLAAAEEALGGERRAIEATLTGLSSAIDRMKGQGDQLDDIDEKLGAAFEQYTKQVEAAVNGLFGHVKSMQDQLNPALDTMREIVEQAEQFAPQSRRS